MMNENLMVEYVYAIKDYTKETIIGAFYDLSDAERNGIIFNRGSCLF